MLDGAPCARSFAQDGWPSLQNQSLRADLAFDDFGGRDLPARFRDLLAWMRKTQNMPTQIPYANRTPAVRDASTAQIKSKVNPPHFPPQELNLFSQPYVLTANKTM